MISQNFKNVLVVSTGFLFLFTAYGGLQSLQSSLNAAQGMGVASLSVIYAGIIISSMFLPPIMIKNLDATCRYNPHPNLLHPGFGRIPLWSAKCTYLTISGNVQAAKHNKKGADVVNHYFGIFFFIFQSSAVWGNLMSSLIFGQDTNISYIVEVQIYTDKISTFLLNGVLNLSRRDVCLVGVGVLAILIVSIFLDNIDHQQTSQFRGTGNRSDWRLLTLIPLTIYSGFEQSFLSGEYTKNYVTCALGIHYVGYVMMCFGATNSLSSFLFGRIALALDRFRNHLFSAGATNLSCIIALLFWRPHPDQLPVFFVCFPALWGMADASALYGVLFPRDKEAAFANYRMWESLGFVIAFAYSTFLCVEYKLYIVLAVLVISMITYPVVEYYEYKNPTQPIEQATYENPKNKARKRASLVRLGSMVFQTQLQNHA
uniref:Unc-93 homolog A n=1 Tax=Xiphophorus maculatus TaxID=8083 RepID=A0A3B5RD39_XIPMA